MEDYSNDPFDLAQGHPEQATNVNEEQAEG